MAPSSAARKWLRTNSNSNDGNKQSKYYCVNQRGAGKDSPSTIAAQPHKVVTAAARIGNPQEDAYPPISPSLSHDRRIKQMREAAGRSKTGVWGPTHSKDESDDDYTACKSRLHTLSKDATTVTPDQPVKETSSRTPSITPTTVVVESKDSGSNDTNPQGSGSMYSKTPSSSSTGKTTFIRQEQHKPNQEVYTPMVSPTVKEEEDNDDTQSPQQQSGSKSPFPTALERIWNQAGTYFSPEATRHFSSESKKVIQKHADIVADYLNEACQPCRPGGGSTVQTFNNADDDDEPVLGISRMESPQNDYSTTDKISNNSAAANKDVVKSISPLPLARSSQSVGSNDSPVERRRQRHAQRAKLVVPSPETPRTRHEEIEVTPNHHVQVNLPPTDFKTKRKAPVEQLEVKANEAEELNRSISELTMRSSYAGGETLQKIPDNRRMAYYAVGKHHRQSGRGGNRRCYFSGKLILGGAPFYAGTVQQGLRTLVVFCLPSAIGLPEKDSMLKSQRAPSATGMITAVSPSRVHSRASRPSLADGGRPPSLMSRRRQLSSSGNASIASKSMSRLSSLDDLSLSIDGDLDPNWGLDHEFLLKVLPPASSHLLTQMQLTYPEQFETLPIQVRKAECWKLYVKFCFFSGLPIAEGEMHYKVRDEIADEVYGEEIVFSHEVMEAVNGESADMLSLPNQKAFRYLRKHYAQQCSKLDDRVFKRTAWERVAPEV